MKPENVDEATNLLKQFKGLSDFLVSPPQGAVMVSAGSQSVTITQVVPQLLKLVQIELDAVQKRLSELVSL